MKLTSLDCSGTKVSDLTPLKGMALTYITTLENINGMPAAAFWKQIEDSKKAK